MSAPTIATAFGLLLLLWSAPTLYKMAVESYVSNAAASHYEFTKHFRDENRADWRGNTIILSDSLGVQQVDFYHEVWAPIGITINGKDYSIPHLVRIRPRHTNSNRYHGSVAIAILRDKHAGTERLGVIQYFHDPQQKAPQRGLDFQARLLLVDEAGLVTEDVFWHSQRADPPYRYMFMYTATMAATGFVYGVYEVWPTLFYPILYPWLSGALGALLAFIGGFSLLRRKGLTTRETV